MCQLSTDVDGDVDIVIGMCALSSLDIIDGRGLIGVRPIA